MAFGKFGGSRRPSQQSQGEKKYQRLTGLFPVNGKRGQYFGVVGTEYADKFLEDLDKIRQDGQTIGLTFFINDQGPCGLTYTAVDADEKKVQPRKEPRSGGQKPYVPRERVPVREPVIPNEPVDDSDYQVEDYGV